MATSLRLRLLGDRSGVLLCAALGMGVAGVLALRIHSKLPLVLAPVVATIDIQKTYQTLAGFGASTAYYQDWLGTH